MARFLIPYTPSTDRSEPYWTGFPTWAEVSDDTKAMVVIIEVPDHARPPDGSDPADMAAYWHERYPWLDGKLATVWPASG